MRLEIYLFVVARPMKHIYLSKVNSDGVSFTKWFLFLTVSTGK